MLGDGTVYTGDFKMSQRHGQGILKMGNGQKYIGGWKNNEKHGFAYFTEKNGKRRNGEWKNDKRIRWIGEPVTGNSWADA